MSEPPSFILVSQHPLLSTANPITNNIPLSSALAHPTIHYHYKDDSPLVLLPSSDNELVLVLDYDPSTCTHSTARSLSKNIAVTDLKVSDAGAGVEDTQQAKNDKMYILETSAIHSDRVNPDISQHEQSPDAILTTFKHRNTLLRRALDYPDKLNDQHRPAPPSPSTSL